MKLIGSSRKRYDDEQNGLLMDMPAEQKGGISAKSDGADKMIPGWFRKQFDQAHLMSLACVAPDDNQHTI